MAGEVKRPVIQNLAKLKEEIGELLANESGRIDASIFKDKYKKYFKKNFQIPKNAKLADFLQTYMSDVVEISKQGSVRFIVGKSKRKETVNVAVQQSFNENEGQSVWRTPVTNKLVKPVVKPSYLTATSNSLASQPTNRQPNIEPKTTLSNVNDTATRIIEELAKEHFVEVDLVKKRLFQHYKVSRARELGFRRDDEIPALKDLIRKHREINACIQAFALVRAVSTLKELSQCVTNLYSDAHEFEDLKVGPLVKHPLVYEYFKFPANLEPPDVTTLKVMKYLRQFMNINKLWREQVKMQDFLEYLMEQMNCSSPYHLGVKIESLALMIKVVKRCSSNESVIRKEAERQFNIDIANEIEEHLQKTKRRLLGGGNSYEDPDALVNKLVGLSPVDILKKLFEYCVEFFTGKTKKNVEAFIQTCLSERECRRLFQLALHKACRQLVVPVEADYVNHIGYVHNDELSDEEPSVQQPSPPALGELRHEVKAWLVKLSSASMNTRLLGSVEERILGHFGGFQAFRDLGHGTFLKFLSENKDLESLISFSGCSSELALGNSADKSDIIAIIQQCGADYEAKILKSIICAQYRLDASFNFSSLDGIVEKSYHQARDSSLAPPKIVYEACLVSKSLESFEDETKMLCRAGTARRKNERAGLLGYLNENKAILCLYQTPLLEDLACWSNWDHVFAPSYGNLKIFLRKVNQTPCKDDLVAMETTTGSLLRVTRCTSVGMFLESAKKADVIGTAGHLVSLVLHHGGIEKAPLALLANNMEQALLFLMSSESSSVDGCVAKFAIRCLKRIPSLMRVALAMQIFIQPLKQVFGNVAAPGLVLKHCETYEEKSMIHGLGVCLGITEWQEDFKKKLEPCLSTNEIQEERRDARIIEDQRESLKKQSQSQNNKESSVIVDDKAIVDKTLVDDDEEKGKDDDNSDETKVPLESENSEVLDEKDQRCRDVIDSIRRDEFGIGVELPPEHLEMIEKQRSREGRSLHRLSSELYSKDTHFVLELVQNADDNCYPESSAEPPSIAFIVNTEKVVVLNNEVGFQEKNIRALCDVGQSTKGKQRYGYIGQKGIGFKSVFRITDTPEVHSNGYHVKFDAKSGPTGYILPHWCEAAADEDSCVHGNRNSWATCIVLTLKDEMKKEQRKTLVARFYDIQPSLLLFLRRLRQIKIVDEVSNNSREMVRRDLGDNLIEITHSKGGDLWFVVKKELKPASGMKPEIETTEIALAFPIATANSNLCVSLEDIAAQISGKSSVQQPVFAFLPLRSYGFRFIIQADFDVPSSREDVDKDSAWNQWLRSEISNLFVQAFDDFKGHPRFQGLSSIVQFLHFIPLENEILDFFKPVTRAIRDAIRSKACIPCRSLPNDSLLKPDAHVRQDEVIESSEQSAVHDANNHQEDNLSGDELQWVYPSQTVVAEDHLIEKFISDQDLSRYLGKCYLHPDVRPFLNPVLRRFLGVETLSCRHLIDIGKAITGEKQGKHSLEDFCRWVAKWLCCVYRCLEHERDCSVETLQEIASLSLFPLSNGEYMKLSRHSVFLPLEKTVKGEQTTTKASKKAAAIIHKDLRSLHPMILTSLDDIGRSQVRKLLEQLQVKCLTSRDLIEHHVIPSLQSNQKHMVKSSEILCSFIIYIKEQWDLDPNICDFEVLRTCVLLKTSKGFVNPATEPVHFTVEYGNETNLKRDFPSVSWTLLDNTYLCHSAAGKAQSSWEKFFSSLGVAHFIAIERKDVCLSKSELSSSVWSSVSEFWPQVTSDGRYIIKDYASSELEKLLSPDSSEEEQQKLAEILDQNWDEKYAKYANVVPFMDKQGKEIGQTYPSIFLLLTEYSWMPSKYGNQNSSKLARCCPKDLFLDNEEVVRLLGNHTWYATPRMSNPKFLTALGIQTSVEFDTLVQIFMKWVEESQSEDDIERTFETSIEHIGNVYRFMESQIGNNANKRRILEDITKDKPVVFVPDEFKHSQSPSRTIPGQFVARKRVYWRDPSNLMQKTSHALSALTQPRSMMEHYYPDDALANFFVNFLKIDENPNLKEYVGLMEAIASQSSMASGPIVDDMMYVYNIVGKKCMKENKDSVTNVWFIKNQLSCLKVFPTKEDKWVSLDEKPLFSDDKYFEKLFREDEARKRSDETETANMERSREKVHFVKMGLQPKPFKKSKQDRNEDEEEREKVEIRRITRNVRIFFASVCGIPNLSQCASQEIIPALISESYHLQLFLHKWIPYIQMFLFYKQRVHHENLQDQGMVEALANVACFGAKTLEVVYRLSTHPSVNVFIKKNCVIDKRDLTVYVTDSNLNDTKDLITELAIFFGHSAAIGELDNFISMVIQQDDINYYMSKQGLDAVPDEVQVWNVPEPVCVPILEPLQELVPETNDDPYPTELTSDRQQGVNEVDGEPRGLQSWPPRSSAIPPNEAAGKNPSTEQVLTMWPPPAPPEAYSVPVVANQVTADQRIKATHDDQGLSNPDPKGIPPQSNHPLANAVGLQPSGARERLASEPSNVEAATAMADNVAMVPRPSLSDVNTSQRIHTRPLAVVNNEVQVQLEEIHLDSSIERTALISLASSANAEEVGRWGEDCVFKVLQKITEGNEDSQVIWVNENNESGLPYDIILKEKAVETTFIEVKSTTSSESNLLPISSQEIQCAFNKKDKYHLYRVYNSGDPHHFRVSRLPNLATNLDSKAVRLYMFI